MKRFSLLFSGLFLAALAGAAAAPEAHAQAVLHPRTRNQSQTTNFRRIDPALRSQYRPRFLNQQTVRSDTAGRGTVTTHQQNRRTLRESRRRMIRESVRQRSFRAPEQPEARKEDRRAAVQEREHRRIREHVRQIPRRNGRRTVRERGRLRNLPEGCSSLSHRRLARCLLDLQHERRHSD